MRIWEINAALMELLEQVDPETGELTCDLEQLEALTLAREEKLEGLALYTKNLDAEAKAIRDEEKNLAERRRSLENKSERAKVFLEQELAGEKLTTSKVAVSYRKSTALEIGEGFWSWAVDHPEFVRRKDPEPEKKAITDAIKSGLNIPGAELVTRQSLVIK